MGQRGKLRERLRISLIHIELKNKSDIVSRRGTLFLKKADRDYNQ
jgi:hypothetical protein